MCKSGRPTSFNDLLSSVRYISVTSSKDSSTKKQSFLNPESSSSRKIQLHRQSSHQKLPSKPEPPGRGNANFSPTFFQLTQHHPALLQPPSSCQHFPPRRNPHLGTSGPHLLPPKLLGLDEVSRASRPCIPTSRLL